MVHRFSNPLAGALGAATVLSTIGLAALSLPQVTFAQDADVGTSSRPTRLGQNTENTTGPPRTPAPENRAKQPPFDPIAARINYPHERLRITPAQEPLWAKVAQVMRENATAVAPLIKQRFQSAQHGNAIDYLNSYEKLGEAQLDGLKRFVAAFQALYNSLSADQKKIADSIFRLSPLSMIGGIPELAEALVALAPYYPYYPSYATLPPPYPVYPYYPAYPYYPYYRPWFWGPPIGLGVSPFFFHRQHRFFFHAQHRIHAFHSFNRAGNHR
jgi:LTXXQ motif family protein